ncbi:MAG: DUF1778 domain-containing protein [Alphaproteobacteria bacterium]|nr:DUF1778 domain-containing protein [Alphaproteobacteria bacterium]
MPRGITATNGRRRRSDRNFGEIRIRVSVRTTALLRRAASLENRELADFVLSCASRHAEAALLDQNLFELSPEAHVRFLHLLDNPPEPGKAVRRRYDRKAPWSA